ncbi:MAG TPA: hypothetical protein VFA11_19110 [Acidimicrobiales bacterium]|nr:hypothetical protein [Acidimicrobiales bacterium]
MAGDHTRPSDATRQAEADAARADHDADRPPTSEEARRAEEHRTDPSVAEHERDMAERGVSQKGEGRI